MSSLGSILIGSLEIALPPINIDPSTYASWFGKKTAKMFRRNSHDMEKYGTRRIDIQQKNLIRYLFIIVSEMVTAFVMT